MRCAASIPFSASSRSSRAIRGGPSARTASTGRSSSTESAPSAGAAWGRPSSSPSTASASGRKGRAWRDSPARRPSTGDWPKPRERSCSKPHAPPTRCCPYPCVTAMSAGCWMPAPSSAPSPCWRRSAASNPWPWDGRHPGPAPWGRGWSWRLDSARPWRPRSGPERVRPAAVSGSGARRMVPAWPWQRGRPCRVSAPKPTAGAG